MALTLSLQSIPADAPSGSVVGTFNADGVRFQGARPEALLIVGRLLVTTWEGVSNLAQIPISVHGPGGPVVNFTITITPPAPTVQVNGSSNPLTVASGAAITATVASGPGNATDWLGVYAVGSVSGPSDPPSWKYLANDSTSTPSAGAPTGTVHLVVPAVAGQYETRFFAANSFTVAAKSAVITASAPPPPTPTLVLTVTPAAASFEDTAPAGTVLATATAKYSDGSIPASVTVTSSDPSFAQVGVPVGGVVKIVTARALVPGPQTGGGDDGTRNLTITASDGLGATTNARLF